LFWLGFVCFYSRGVPDIHYTLWLSLVDWCGAFYFFVQFVGFVAVVGVVLIFMGYAYLLATIQKYYSQPYDVVPVAVCFLSYIVIEYFLYWLLSGFNYGALFFAAQNVPYLLTLGAVASPVAISAAVVVINIFILAFIFVCHACHVYTQLRVCSVAVCLALLNSFDALWRATNACCCRACGEGCSYSRNRT